MQLAGVPVPTTVAGAEVSTGCAGAGQVALGLPGNAPSCWPPDPGPDLAPQETTVATARNVRARTAEIISVSSE